MKAKPLFEPKSALLIGSSKITEKVGMTSPKLFDRIAYNMKKYFKGSFSVLDIEKSLDIPKAELGIVVLPPKKSIILAEKLMKNGIKAIVQITGGFSEKERKEYLDIAMKYHTRLLGPNTIMGLINTENGLNTTFERDLHPKKGDIAIISQSGGVGAALLDWAKYYGIGISKFVFMGDKLDLDDANVLEYLKEDKQTKVIAMYMEGLKKGRRFVNLMKEITKEKPTVVLKGGITKEGAKRALSHTASVAGSDEIFNAAFIEAGMIRVIDIEELFDSALVLSKQQPMKGKNVAIVSNVGGPAILAADAVAREGLRLARFSKEVKDKISSKYPGIDVINPIDIIADARADRYETILDLVLNDKNVDGVMVINMLKSCFFESKDARIIYDVWKRYDKPIVDVPCGGEDFVLVSKVLRNTNIPTYDLPDKAARALNVLYKYWRISKA